MSGVAIANSQIHREARASAGEWAGLVILLIASAAVRLPYWPMHRDLADSLNYSIGALYTHVAHPPGSVGYCVLLGWVNDLFHDIKFTLIFVSFVAAMLAIFTCHRMAKAMGMGAAPALAAAALFGFSIDTFKASLLGGPHILEGLFSLLFGLLAWKAISKKRRGDALLASLVFALAGALRPTTTLLLFPLWLFMVARTLTGTGKLRRLALHLLIIVPVIAAWNWGNNHYMTLNGYGGRTYEDQVLAKTGYDFDSLNPTATTQSAVEHLTYHMPGAELLAWVEVKTGLRLMPHVPGWPTPSPSRAMRLMLVQALKQGWWIVVSLPLVVFLPILFLLNPKQFRSYRLKNLFFGIWILPAIVFFILGHMGTLTYLQVYLGALCLWSADVLWGQTETPHKPFVRKLSIAVVIGCLLLNVCFHTLTRPFQAADGMRRNLDLVLMQFDGYSIKHNFGTSRRTNNTTGFDQVTGPDRDYETAPDDRALLDAAWRNHFQYLPPR